MDGYHEGGDCSENRIKDLKIRFGMVWMPCGQTHANTVFFRIRAIFYDIYRLSLMKALDENWHRYQTY